MHLCASDRHRLDGSFEYKLYTCAPGIARGPDHDRDHERRCDGRSTYRKGTLDGSYASYYSHPTRGGMARIGADGRQSNPGYARFPVGRLVAMSEAKLACIE